VEHDLQELNDAGGEEPEDLSGRVGGSRSAPLFPLMGEGASFWTLGTAEYGFLRRTLAPRPVTGLTTRQGRAAHCSAPLTNCISAFLLHFPKREFPSFQTPDPLFERSFIPKFYLATFGVAFVLFVGPCFCL